MTRAHLSVSQLRLLLGCARRWYNKYVLELPDPPNRALKEGIAFHKAVELDLKDRLCGRRRSAGDIAREAVELTRAELGDVPVGAGGVALWLSTLRAVPAYAELEPELVEHEFAVEFAPGWELKGRFDAVARGVVFDFKTASVPWTHHEVARDVQATAYLWAARQLGIRAEQVNFVVLVKKLPYVQPIFTAVRTPEQLSAFEELLNEVVRFIERGIFLPNPEYKYCSPGLCPYWAGCFGGDDDRPDLFRPGQPATP